jgi:hypothetical protein
MIITRLRRQIDVRKFRPCAISLSGHDVTINSPRVTPIIVDACNDGRVQSD